MTSQLNVPLLRKALEYITEHPEEHNQRNWAQRTSCGTTFCLAGTVAKLTGHDFIWDLEGGTQALLVTNGREISEVAQDELGLDNVDAHLLFHCYDIRELWETVEEITDGEIRRLP